MVADRLGVLVSEVGDLVLVHFNDQPAFFARVEEIRPDVKPKWHQIRLLVLQVPPKEVTWILRDEYIQGEQFTMGGHPVRLERLPGVGEFTGLTLEVESDLESGPGLELAPSPGSGGDKVISLLDRRKSKQDEPDDVA